MTHSWPFSGTITLYKHQCMSTHPWMIEPEGRKFANNYDCFFMCAMLKVQLNWLCICTSLFIMCITDIILILVR